MAEYLHEGQQGSQTHLVILAGNALLKVIKAHLLPALLYYGTRNGHLDSQELIALTVLAGACLEKAHQALHL